MILHYISLFEALPIFIVLYFATHGLHRMTVCLVGSYLFYGALNWRFLPLLFITTVFNYFVALRLSSASRNRNGSIFLMGIAWNLGLLIGFKYLSLIVDSFASVFRASSSNSSLLGMSIILPLGISFFTFQAIGYLVEVHRGNIEAERNIIRFATFIAFFPKILAGPIVQATHFLPQLQRDRRSSKTQVYSGIDLILWGVFLKVVIADSLAGQVELILSIPEQATSLSLIIALVFFTFQIYCDFNGYSCMAIGFGRILGFDLGVNFDRPYLSSSFSTFWRRWHISLSTWIRDYVFIPLGGSRRGFWTTSRNLVVAMTVCGIWHGASCNFALWGFLHGLYLVMQRLIGPVYARVVKMLHIPYLVRTGIAVLTVFVLTVFAWLFFRVTSFGSALYILQRIAHFDNLWLTGIPNIVLVLKGAALIGFLIVIEAISFWTGVGLLNRAPLTRAIALLLLLLSVSLFGTFKGHSFIYAGF